MPEHADANEPIIIEPDPLSVIPDDALLLLGRIMAWSTHIEHGLFRIYWLLKKGDAVERRREFYASAKGMKMRIKLVRDVFAAQPTETFAKAIGMLLDECTALADLRNEWGHNPLLPFGKQGQLHQWEIGTGEFAGTMKPVDVPLLTSLLPHLHQLYTNVNNMGALLNDPKGKGYAMVFGPNTPDIQERVRRLMNAEADPVDSNSGDRDLK